MAEIERIRVMVSSRSLVKVFEGGQKLTDVRKHLQKYLHTVRWAVDGNPVGRRQPIFDVWIHEDETAVSAGTTTFQLSLEEVERADVVLILYNGDAGSVQAGSDLGICHAELQAAVSRRPEIVFMVRLLPVNEASGLAGNAFRTYVNSL